jgi:hypothetical protein
MYHHVWLHGRKGEMVKPNGRRATLPCQFILLPLVLVLSSCGDSNTPTGAPDPQGTSKEPGPPVYRVAPPGGKLPWPQHNPQWGEAKYDSMLADLWVINNFGLYQGSPDRSSLYLHTALDVVLPNGTPVYAVDSGIVRANLGGDEHFRTLVVEGKDEPGRGWAYTHIYGFSVQPGDTVSRGTHLGVVNFSGLAHVHLTRLELRAGGNWGAFSDLLGLQPDTFFVFSDNKPPVFDGVGGFRYVRENTDSAFMAAEPDGVVTVSGDVDIVVGLRDPGEWTQSTKYSGFGPQGFGDRHAPSRIEYQIERAGVVAVRAVAFDFSRMLIQVGGSGKAARTLTIYEHYESVTPPPPERTGNRTFSYFVITNSDGRNDGVLRELDLDGRANAWCTAEEDSLDQARYPDGDYTVTVWAYDSKGNVASRSEAVRVRNREPL